MSANMNESFYKDFVRLCNSIGKSPCLVVTECGLSKPCVTRWKNGSNPTDATAMKIAEYFGKYAPVVEAGPKRVVVRKIHVLRKGEARDG